MDMLRHAILLQKKKPKIADIIKQIFTLTIFCAFTVDICQSRT